MKKQIKEGIIKILTKIVNGEKLNKFDIKKASKIRTELKFGYATNK